MPNIPDYHVIPKNVFMELWLNRSHHFWSIFKIFLSGDHPDIVMGSKSPKNETKRAACAMIWSEEVDINRSRRSSTRIATGVTKKRD